MDTYLLLLVIAILAGGFYMENYLNKSRYLKYIGWLDWVRVIAVLIIIYKIIDLRDILSITLSSFFLVYTLGKIIFRRNPILYHKPVYHYFKIGTSAVFFLFLIYFIWSLTLS